MRFGILLAGLLCAAPVNAATIVVHSDENPWAYIWKDIDSGREYVYYESIVGGFIEGPSTVRFDLQGGAIKNPTASLGWYDDIWSKVGGQLNVQNLSGGDHCDAGGCNSWDASAPSFITDFSYGDTFIQFSFDQPKSYFDCPTASKPGVCGENWYLQDWFQPEIQGGGPKAFTVTYTGNLRPHEPWSPPVPEPQTWMMMIAGFGLVGAAMRRGPRAYSSISVTARS